VGDIGFSVTGLAFDASRGVLLGTAPDDDDTWLIEIDPATGQGTSIGLVGFEDLEGLALDPITDTLYATERFAYIQLIEIDPLTGSGTSIATCYVPGADGHAVHVFDIEHETETYCTAGASASGCTALMDSSGEASASAPHGFTVIASGVEGAKDGLFFFGTNGKQANPWGNGTSYQCVKPPLKRTGVLVGTGTGGACNGHFGRDLNAFWCPSCPGAAANPTAGAMLQAQLWYRDPLSTSNQPTSLSDALEAYVGP
jgi:hypothetical protein